MKRKYNISKRQKIRNITCAVNRHLRDLYEPQADCLNEPSINKDAPISETEIPVQVGVTDNFENEQEIILPVQISPVPSLNSDSELHVIETGEVESESTDTSSIEYNSSDSETSTLGEELEVEHLEHILDNDRDNLNADNVENENSDLVCDLRQWALMHNISHEALNRLLQILKPHHPNLAIDSRTVLQSHAGGALLVDTFDNGEYYHMGLKQGLLQKLKTGFNQKFQTTSTLELSFNIDGIPVYKSKYSDFWPILARCVQTKDVEPFVVGLFVGSGKPKPIESYFKKFVDEILQLIENGLFFENKQFRICLGPFICDAPAKAYIKCIKNHNGYFGCDYCEQRGDYKKKVIFEVIDSNLRSNESFRSKSQIEHHSLENDTPLLKLPIDMIKNFPIDYMHLVCLGCVKRILKSLMKSKSLVKQPSHILEAMNNKLVSISEFTPIEFSRKPRSLNEIEKWKATELRQFVLYTGVFVFRHPLPRVLVEHFLLLHCAITILCRDNPSQDMINYAESILKIFVSTAGDVYGKGIYVYNIHNLVHLADHAKIYGGLDRFSAFPFEAFLGKLKKLVRTPNKPLQQVVLRLNELKHLENNQNTYSDYIPLMEHKEGPVIDGKIIRQFQKFIFKDFTLRNRPPDNCCELKTGEVVHIENIVEELNTGTFSIFGRYFMESDDAYSYPCASSKLGIKKVSRLSTGCLKSWKIDMVLRKCYFIPITILPMCGVSVPLLHSF